MASAAVTAASAAAALVPFEMSLGYRSSLVMVGGSLDKANQRCDLSSELRPGQPRPQRAFAHAKRRLGPKSTVFSASRLDSPVRKMAFKPSERRFHAL